MPQRNQTGCLCRFLPKDLAIIGYARSALDINDLRKKIKGFLKSKDEAKKEDFVQHVTYVQGAYDKSEAFENLQSKLEEREQKSDGGPVGRLYYLALPPSVYPQVCWLCPALEPSHTTSVFSACPCFLDSFLQPPA